MSGKKVEKWIDLSGLPMKEGIGSLKEKQVIDWKNLENNKYKIPFKYDDIVGFIDIISYNADINKLIIKYNDKIEYTISCSCFSKCSLGKYLGKITNEFRFKLGDVIKDSNRNMTILECFNDVYYDKTSSKKHNNKSYKYKCNICGWEGGIITECNLNKNIGCSCCTNKTTVVGINDVATTHPHLVKYFVNQEDAKTTTVGTDKKFKFKCPECGQIKDKEMSIYTLNRYGLACPKCGDGRSYPEKFMFSVLDQLNLDFKCQTKFDWSKNINHNNKKLIGDKIYDFYFKYNNKEYIIETHGNGHYEETKWGKSKINARNLDDEIENDKCKKQLAIQNGIKEENYIVINCKYSELEWIKNSIINSKLNDIFNLSNIDWLKCNSFACKSIILEVCKIKNENPNLTSIDISKIVKMDRKTINKYLKIGNDLGLCKYDRNNEVKIGNLKKIKIL